MVLDLHLLYDFRASLLRGVIIELADVLDLDRRDVHLVSLHVPKIDFDLFELVLKHDT